MDRPLNNLPLDFCKRLADIASPGSLRSLCLASKAAYKFFKPTLYRLIDGPSKVGKLLMTLGTERCVGLGDHPASLVHDLRINCCFDWSKHGNSPEGQKKKEEQMKAGRQLILRAIDSTARTSAGQSRLRNLWFTSNAAMEDIGALLHKRARFPHLEDLRISPPNYYDVTDRKNFQVGP